MGQNDIFTSPLGLGLGVGLGTAAGAALIGLSTYIIFKYAIQSPDQDIRDSVSSVSDRSSSFFTVGEDSYRDSSFSEPEPPNPYEEFKKPLKKDMIKQPSNVVVRTTGQKGPTGGKLSKKRRRKNRVKKHNTLRK